MVEFPHGSRPTAWVLNEGDIPCTKFGQGFTIASTVENNQFNGSFDASCVKNPTLFGIQYVSQADNYTMRMQVGTLTTVLCPVACICTNPAALHEFHGRKTTTITQKKKLPVPQVLWTSSKVVQMGRRQCAQATHYFGGASTRQLEGNQADGMASSCGRLD